MDGWKDDVGITIVCSTGVEDVNEKLEGPETDETIEIEELRVELVAALKYEPAEAAKDSIEPVIELEEEVNVCNMVAKELEDVLVKVVDGGSGKELDSDVRVLAKVEISAVEKDVEEVKVTGADDIVETPEELVPDMPDAKEVLEELCVETTLKVEVACFKETEKLSVPPFFHPPDSLLSSHMYLESRLKPNPFPAPLAK